MRILGHLGTGLFLLLFLANCSDHRLVDTGQRFRLKKVNSQAAHIATYLSFNYNSAGRLISFTAGSHPDPTTGQLTVLQYDAQGRLMQSDTQPKLGLSDRRRVYKYDADGRLIVVTTFGNNDRLGSYILENEVILIYEGTSKTPVTISRDGDKSTLTYKDSNVIQSVSESTASIADSSFTVVYTTTYTYDDRPNPLYSIYPTLVSVISPDALINKNNRISVESTASNDKNNRIRREDILTYNADGLLAKRSNSPFELFFQETYEYEAY